MLGPLHGRKKTSAAAELAELRKITTFKEKNTIFSEHPVSLEASNLSKKSKSVLGHQSEPINSPLMIGASVVKAGLTRR